MATTEFNYSEPAELFGGAPWVGRKAGMKYRRFDTAAEAIRFAVEELTGPSGRSCILEVNESRFNHAQIRSLYDGCGYPLPRRLRKENDAT